MFKEISSFDVNRINKKFNIKSFLEKFNIKSKNTFFKKSDNFYFDCPTYENRYWYTILQCKKAGTYETIANIFYDDDEWYYVYSSKNKKYYKCDQLEGLEECLRFLKII